MKQVCITLTAALLALGSVQAIASEELAGNSGCLACHSVDAQLIGPAYKDIAAKYSGDEGAAAMLAEKIKTGGSGNWGTMPMPPNAHVKDEDIQSIVNWILSL